MATYEDIYGKRVKEFATDPTLTSSYEGQVWYDKSTGVLKSVVSFAAWSSTSNMVNALARPQGAGTTSAGLSMGGQDGSDTKLTVTEEYNGTGWSLGGSMPAAKSDHAGAGTQTAAFAAGGSPYLNSAYNYNGTSWSGIPNIGTARQKFAGCGTTTASLVFGAQVPGSPPQGGQTEEYNGSSWSEQNDLGTARAKLAGCGTQTAGLGFGGYQPSLPSNPKQKAQTEQYDGTSWSEVSDMITATSGGGGAGTQTAAIAFGGNTPSLTTATQDWDGTSWTTSPVTLGTAAGNVGGAGTNTSALSIAGYAPSVTSNVEEYNISINTITAAAWAAGGSISTVRTNVGSTSEGSQTAAMVWGGRTGPPPSGPFTSNKSDTYDGSSFSTAPNLNTASRTRSGGGTTSAAWCAGGTSPTYINSTEEFNGSSWTSVTNAPLVFFASGTGAQTAGLIVGINSDVDNPGGSDAYPGISLEYDGTNWATGGSPSADRTSAGCSGTQTAGTLISGQNAPGTSPGGSLVTTIEEYNGSSWTSGGASVVAAKELQAACRGTQTATLITGGNINPPAAGITSCSIYDGTSTATTASMGTGRRGHGSDGGPSSGLVMTGQSSGPPANNNPNYTANAEEFTAATTAIASKTLTTS